MAPSQLYSTAHTKHYCSRPASHPLLVRSCALTEVPECGVAVTPPEPGADDGGSDAVGKPAEEEAMQVEPSDGSPTLPQARRCI